MTTLTIATWNIAGGRTIRSNERFDYDKEDLAYFADELKKINPDIIALQESHKNDKRSVARELEGLVDVRIHVDEEISPSHIDPEYRLSLAVLSNLPDVHVDDNVRFPYPEFPLMLPSGKPALRHEKALQRIEFEVGTEPLDLVNLQMMPLAFLGASYESEEGRAFAKEMEGYISTYMNPKFAIIVGDFNYEKAETLYSGLLSEMKSALPDAPTRPNGKKTDYIFVPKAYEIVESGIVETRTDHYLCYAKVSF